MRTPQPYRSAVSATTLVRHCALALVLFLAAPARAEGTWTISSWTSGFTASDDNLILHQTPSAASGLYNADGAKDVRVLTDGYAAPLEKGATQCLGNNAVLTWSFASPVSIREVRVYSTWPDNGRSQLNVASVVADGTNTIGGATGAQDPARANLASLKSGTDDYLAEGVSSVTVTFGPQKNSYVGYAEVEVIGIVGLPGTYMGIDAEFSSDVAPCSGQFSIEAASQPGAGATFDWVLNGVSVGDGPTLNRLFSEPGAYTLSVTVAEGDSTRTATRDIIVYGPVVYVDELCPTPVYPYATRATAARNVADALDSFTHAQEMHVFPGQYTTPTVIALENGQKLIGEGDPSEIRISPLSLSGNRLVRASGSGSEVRNVTLSKGAAGSFKGGCLNISGGARCFNCHLVGGTCARGQYAGCLYVEGDGTVVSNCVIGNVKIGTDGQASNCPIYYGLGLYLKSGLVTHCVITNVQTHGIHRSSGHSQGVAVQMAGGTLRNCLVAHNLATDGKEGSERRFAAGIYQTGGTVENCTITDNVSGSGPAGYCRTAGTMVNGIIWGNANSDVEGLYGDQDVSGNMAAALSHSCTNDPVFKAPASGDYRLDAASPCANAGQALPWITHETTDLAGFRRLVGRAVDLGCYEIAIFPTMLTVR